MYMIGVHPPYLQSYYDERRCLTDLEVLSESSLPSYVSIQNCKGVVGTSLMTFEVVNI